ncbi:hypothetical protein [Xenophilus sp.]|uniref:hypothetical protein n=1 Tax=Xenophilus sp. TaxID=1873499 RepID=UPI0037DCDB22
MAHGVGVRHEPISEARHKLLQELEFLIGGETYNASIQNWGPGGVFLGEGRQYRYPLTVVNGDGEKSKVYGRLARDATASEVRGAYYGFGANHLHIGMGLLRVIKHLETHYGLVVDKASREE